MLQQDWDESRTAPAGTQFINIQHWPETQQIALLGNQLRIGAGVRLETARTHALVTEHMPLLAQTLAQLGAMGVRRLGTLGGNIGWGEGDCCPLLLAMDTQVELADGSLHMLGDVMQHRTRPLMLAFVLPIPATEHPASLVFEKIGYRAAFSPARLRMAMRWSGASKGCAVDRIAAAAPGLPVHRLQATEKLLAYAHELSIQPTLADIRTTCLQTLPPELAVVASRVIAGHCSLLV